MGSRCEWWSDGGDRAAVRWLFELAEDSAAELDGYLDQGRVRSRPRRTGGRARMSGTCSWSA